MKKKMYVCMGCGYRYDPDFGDPPDYPAGTAFVDLPEEWKCPMCGYHKSSFEEQEVGN